MPSCIICHMEIMEGLETRCDCPNEHPVHDDCLKEWLCHSPNCPLCSEPYDPAVIDQFKGYMKEKEQQKQDDFNNALLGAELEKIEKLADKMVFFKFLETVEILADNKNYDGAIERLEAFNNEKDSYKNQKVMFLKGKFNFLRGRFDLAINFLFKLVKEKFDYPDAFLYLGKAYQEIGLEEKAQWAFERIR